ncbi:MAG: IS481 family transposase [candidate division Zixibacteria bacterium HGW-Zixibacteria-1]|nr:MAG: IS481 family transposase [candidate division Zixibacteria bacterium HGW-Zixibacteria-1]
MPWKSRSVMEMRVGFISRTAGGRESISSLCREYGISRVTGYKWLGRYRAKGSVFEASEEGSRRPHRCPTQTESLKAGRVLELRRDEGWGARKLRELLLREGIDLPVITIHRILRRHGLVPGKDVHRPATKRFERANPNDLWQMDFKGEYRLGTGYCYPLSLLDDHSRYAVGLYALPHQKGESVQRCLIDVFERYGIPSAILMDHGVPWWGRLNHQGLTWLTVFLMKQGIELLWSGVGHPQTQGKVERFHRTLKASIWHKGKPYDLAGWQKFFDHFCDVYNRIRPHEALNMSVPADHYRPSTKAYNPCPREWEYPEGALIKRLNSQGSLGYRKKRYFVSEALAGEPVQVEEVDELLLVKYRNTYIREIHIESGRTAPPTRPGSNKSG